ncbi:MAG: hypothetical protein R3349_07125 [Geminicoccaceae bacterium]|nr:hypothetical protein [Geminicoccaceae bacterium]
MTTLGRLWRGDLPLADAFWTWAVLIGIAVNVVTSFLFLISITMDQTVLALVAGYGLSVPYNVVALVGVWRSAGREPSTRSDLYKLAALVLMGVLTLT